MKKYIAPQMTEELIELVCDMNTQSDPDAIINIGNGGTGQNNVTAGDAKIREIEDLFDF